MASGQTTDRGVVSVQLRSRARSSVTGYLSLVASLGFWTLIACLPAQAQQANQPGYDPRQTEKRFEDQQSRQSPGGRPRLPSPQFARREGQGNSKPLFILRRVSIGGATAIP